MKVVIPPRNLSQCVVGDYIDHHLYYAYRKRQDEDYKRLQQIRTKIIDKKNGSKSSRTKGKQSRYERNRSVKKHRLIILENNGNRKEISPTDTLWWAMYANVNRMSNGMRKKFRRRFRVPFDEYKVMVSELKEDKKFERWTKTDAVGENSSPIELLLLGFLRIIGRGWTFDDVSEQTAISEENIRQFYHTYIEYGSSDLYQKYVMSLQDEAQFNATENLYAQAGFNGCCGSADATHVGMLKCPIWAGNNHKGHKLSCPARSYNVVSNHCRQVLNTTDGHPCTWNDKSIVLYDNLVRGVQDGEKLSDREFILLEYNDMGEVVERKYIGAWFMTDNGYLPWSTTCPPDDHAITYMAVRWSEWEESMRKDVECLFGLLKGRFLMLRYGVRTRTIKSCDMLWKTCLALHNRLLFIDGLHENWRNGATSDWEEENSDDVPFAIQRLQNPQLDTSSEEEEVMSVLSERREQYEMEDGTRFVRKMTMPNFRQCLIEHFDIRFNRGDVVWPRRFPTEPVI